MTITGVNLVTAANLVAMIRDVGCFASARKLVGCLGLGPRVHQSGSSPARTGRISKEGAAAARRVLCESAQAAMRTPAPLRAFGQRVSVRRGRQVAQGRGRPQAGEPRRPLLASGEDYAHANPARVRLKLRRVELLAAEPLTRGCQANASLSHEREREIVLAAKRAYQRLVADRSGQKGGGCRSEVRISKGPRRPSRAAHSKEPQRVCSVARGHPYPAHKACTEDRGCREALDFHRPARPR